MLYYYEYRHGTEQYQYITDGEVFFCTGKNNEISDGMAHVSGLRPVVLPWGVVNKARVFIDADRPEKALALLTAASISGEGQ